MSFLLLLLCFAALGAGVFFRFTGRGHSSLFFLAVPVLFVMFLISCAFVTVDAGNIGVVKRFGEITRQLSPGIHMITPWAETVTPVSVQTKIVAPHETAGSRDLQVVTFQITLSYHTDPQFAGYMLQKYNDDAEVRVVTPAILEAIKAATARYTADELLQKRAEVRDLIETLVRERVGPEHIVAEAVAITDFHFSQEYENAIEAKVTAQQKSEKAENDLKRIKVEAEQQVVQAQAQADSLKAQREQITPELLQLRTIEMMKDKWDGHLPDTMVGGSGALPMMDVLQAAKHRQ